MKFLYLLLAVAGTVLPYAFFLQHFAAEGLSPGAFVSGLFANGVASGAAADLVLSSVVFWVWLFASGDGRRAGFLIPANLLVGLSLALPLWLYLRARDAEASG